MKSSGKAFKAHRLFADKSGQEQESLPGETASAPLHPDAL